MVKSLFCDFLMIVRAFALVIFEFHIVKKMQEMVLISSKFGKEIKRYTKRAKNMMPMSAILQNGRHFGFFCG